MSWPTEIARNGYRAPEGSRVIAFHKPVEVVESSMLVGSSDAMMTVLERADRAAKVDSPVLIAGEAGSGKHSLARWIHRAGDRRVGPFVAVRLAVLPESLMEDELFGSCDDTKGRDYSRHRGAFQAAAGGTLYLAELADLRRVLQARVLRALETGRVSLGTSDQEIEVDVRVIAATSRDVETLLANRQLREDLYYRLNVITISVPPLRKRKADIPALTRHFLEGFAAATGREPARPDGELMRFLENYDWPGNVRQLRNCLESMTRRSGSDVLGVDDLPASLAQDRPALSGDLASERVRTLADLERMAVLRALEERKGNRTRTAESLGISVRTLQRKLKKWRQ